MHDLTHISERNLFVLRFHGLLTAGDGKRGFLDIVGHPGFHPDVWILTDTRAVTEARIGFTDMFTTALSVLSEIRRFSPKARAVILVGNETQFGLARMLEQVIDSLASLLIWTAATPAEAAEALGITEPELESLARPVPPLPPAAAPESGLKGRPADG